MSYVIETGIPIPYRAGSVVGLPGPKSELTSCLDSLNPGQSLLTQDPKDYDRAKQFSLRSKPRKFAFRKMRDGWRIWRVE